MAGEEEIVRGVQTQRDTRHFPVEGGAEIASYIPQRCGVPKTFIVAQRAKEQELSHLRRERPPGEPGFESSGGAELDFSESFRNKRSVDISGRCRRGGGDAAEGDAVDAVVVVDGEPVDPGEVPAVRRKRI